MVDKWWCLRIALTKGSFAESSENETCLPCLQECAVSGGKNKHAIWMKTVYAPANVTKKMISLTSCSSFVVQCSQLGLWRLLSQEKQSSLRSDPSPTKPCFCIKLPMENRSRPTRVTYATTHLKSIEIHPPKTLDVELPPQHHPPMVTSHQKSQADFGTITSWKQPIAFQFHQKRTAKARCSFQL